MLHHGEPQTFLTLYKWVEQRFPHSGRSNALKCSHARQLPNARRDHDEWVWSGVSGPQTTAMLPARGPPLRSGVSEEMRACFLQLHTLNEATEGTQWGPPLITKTLQRIALLAFPHNSISENGIWRQFLNNGEYFLLILVNIPLTYIPCMLFICIGNADVNSIPPQTNPLKLLSF